MRKIPLFVAIALTLSVPLLAIRADEVPEETPGTSEYFTKYVEGRFAFTNEQMVSMWYIRGPEYSIPSRRPYYSIKGSVVQVIEPGKVLVEATEEYDTYGGILCASHRPMILLTAPATKYTQGEQVALWGKHEVDFSCTTAAGKTNTVPGYRTPIPGAITFEQYKKLIVAGVKTPDRVSTVATCVPLPSGEERTRVRQASGQQASTDNAEAWTLATSAFPNQQNGAKAVTLALQATAVRPDEWQFLDTLAAAYARSGEFDKAIETQEKAIQIESQPKRRTLPRSKLNREVLQARLDLYNQRQPFTQELTSAERSSQEKDDLARLTPEALRARLAELESEKQKTDEACMATYDEYAAAETALKKAEGVEKDKAAIIYQQTKDKYQLARQKDKQTWERMELARSILAKQKESAPTIPEPNESN